MTGEDSAEATVFSEERQYEQALMRAGRRLQSLGQLLEQDPKRVVAKGFAIQAEISGARPLAIDLDELRALFDPQAPHNVGRLLAEYQQLLAKHKTTE
jgi:hypothetical protein